MCDSNRVSNSTSRAQSRPAFSSGRYNYNDFPKAPSSSMNVAPSSLYPDPQHNPPRFSRVLTQKNNISTVEPSHEHSSNSGLNSAIGDLRTRGHYNKPGIISPEILEPRSSSLGMSSYRLCHNNQSLTTSSSRNISMKPKEFKNLGNTCYLNATMQCILSSPLISELKKASSSFRDRKMPWDFINLSNANSRDAPAFLESIKAQATERNSEFEGYSQNDAHEFLRVVLLLLHEELNLVKRKVYQEMVDIPDESEDDAAKRWIKYLEGRDNSIVYDIFGGLMKTVTLCEICKYEALNFDPILDISMPIPKKSHSNFYNSDRKRISDIINDFTASETLRDHDRFICPKCKRQVDSKRQRTMYSWPKSLVLHLARFDNRGVKNNLNIEIEEFLDIDKSWCGERKFSDAIRPKPKDNIYERRVVYDGNSYQYELYGVVIHTGSQYSGHYYAYVKCGDYWWCCDDYRIDICDLAKVLRDGSRGGYVLFYNKKWRKEE
eukprot:Tbor_TRINITY_DN4602_c0_g1::TRINITY_DN4602_c0_g1_i1::g.14910::m.14910/K11833/USP2; ubiquitin carboxyl-terminal hydrolase 2